MNRFERLEKAEEHAAKAEAVFSDEKAIVEPQTEALLAVYEMLQVLTDMRVEA